MTGRKPKYDASCYYAGKLVGRCTAADGEAYALLMKQCGGNAARVLQEHAYFSTELKGILKKVAAAQTAGLNRNGSLFTEPKQSPWGEVQTCDVLCPGVFLVSTASHGGTMVSKDIAAVLSPAARKCGFQKKGYLCFEEDSQESVVLRELLDKKLWKAPDRIKDRLAFEEAINQSIRRYNPEYWRARKCGLEAAKPAPDKTQAPSRER